VHAQAALRTTDFDVEEAKNGSYYLKDGELYQKQGGIGRKVETKGKGSKTGLTEQAQAVVRGLIPIRDHLRRVYATTSQRAGEGPDGSPRRTPRPHAAT
jgi:hypothetical protein